jgi:hypothetical protein
MPSWKKVIVSGSDASLNALTVTNGITGSLHGTASWAQNAITASYALNAISASHAITASYAINADFLDGKDSTTFATTGSNIFIGNQTVTGSLNITGSTTQIGNNTLLGNTLLSGSITISGSTAPGSPSASVQIYGDIRQSGYHRFDPVNTNIDTSVSASYIYVSGSTKDLYFSQNGSGYSNVTRLRWLEGNLYTGLLHGGVISTLSPTVYQISSGSGVIVDLNASLNDDPYPTIQYLNWPNLSASIAPFTASYQQAFVGIDSTNNIYAQGIPFNNGQFDNIINIGNVLFQNQSTINGVKTQPSVAYGFEQAQNIFNRAFGPLKLSGYTLSPSGSSTGSLVVASGTAYSPGSNYTIDPNEPSYTVDSGTNVSKIFRYHQSGSTWVYNTNAGAGFTAIDPTQYSNNGTLTAVPGGGSNRQWSIQRVFYFPNSVTKAIVVYYGNATYTTEVEAIANIPFEPFVEAPNTAANAIYLGALVLRNDANFTNSATYKILPGGLFRQVGGSGGGGSTVTQTLAGLSDVNISGPTDGQALVYNTTQAKWINSSAISASITGNAATATSASFATSASYAANGGVTQIIAGANITISPTNGLGQVTITSTGGSGSGGFNTATGSYGSFFDTTTQTASLANTAYPMRFNTTDVTNGVSISGSSNNFIKIANSGIYDLQFSAQLARSAGSGTEDVLIWLRKNGIDLSWTNTDVTFTGGSNVRQVAAWNWFLNAAAGDAYEIVWSTTSANIVIEANTTPNPDVPSVIATVARIDQFLSNTGSFSGSFTGEFTGSLLGTSSFATSALSASFATTASYVLNAVSASFATSASQAQTATTASYVLNAVSASFATSASQAESANTASYVLNAITASFVTASNVFGPFGSNSIISSSYALTASYALNGGSGGGGGTTVTHTQLTASTTWSFNHNLNTQTPLLQVYDLNYEQIIPNEIVSISAFTSEIRFDYTQAGYAVASSGGGLTVTGSTPRLTQTVAATTWSFAHNLGTQFPGFEVFDQNDYVVIPAGIYAIDENNAEIYFATPSTGVAIANFSGIDGVVPSATSASYAATASLALAAISSSYAATASYSDQFNIGQSQTRYATITSSINGSNIVFNVATGSYSSAFFKYTVASASNARSGEIMSVWNGSTVTFTDNSTTDIGSTSVVTSSVAISASNAQLTMQTNTAGWRIKSIATFM